MRSKGLTLTEIVVIVAILLVLAAFVLPALAPTRGRGGRQTDCKNSLKQIGVYFALYQSKFGSMPPPGADTWFQSLWRPDMASDGNLFRCACRGKGSAGTHYHVLPASGSWTVEGEPTFSWGPAGLGANPPAGLPIACDGRDATGKPNHERSEDLNVLYYSGRVDVFALDSPMAQSILKLLVPSTWAAPVGTR